MLTIYLHIHWKNHPFRQVTLEFWLSPSLIHQVHYTGFFSKNPFDLLGYRFLVGCFSFFLWCVFKLWQINRTGAENHTKAESSPVVGTLPCIYLFKKWLLLVSYYISNTMWGWVPASSKAAFVPAFMEFT